MLHKMCRSLELRGMSELELPSLVPNSVFSLMCTEPTQVFCLLDGLQKVDR